MSSPLGWLRAGAILTAALLAVGYAVLLQYLGGGLPGVPFARDTALLPVGWPEMSRGVERQKRALQAGGPARVLIVGMDHDFIASEAAFYQTDQRRAVQETTGAHLFARGSLMYAYWFPLRDQDGATLLLVSFERKELKSAPLRWRCRSLGPIEAQMIRVRGQPVRAYYTRAAYGYLSGGYRRPK